MNYYNDNDRHCCAWLRELIKAGQIPEGEVDERSIADVQPNDLRGYDQIHLFAGIGGWAYALKLAGWPSTRSVWTGSCPCQPLSVAGKRRGERDKRHLWPVFRRLIATCKPDIIFGEQVASKDGRRWLNNVRSDLETIIYWEHFYEGLHAVRTAKTVVGLSEILGEITGRVEATLQGMSEGIRDEVAQGESISASGSKDEKGRKGKAVSTSIRRRSQGLHAGDGSEEEMCEKEPAIRFGSTFEGIGVQDSESSVRDDWITAEPVQQRNLLGQPIDRPNRTKSGIRIRQHQNRMLWDQRGHEGLGGRGAFQDCLRLVKEEVLGDERRIAEAFSYIVALSVDRLRITGVRSDLEAMGYAVGAADLCAASVGAPHIRQRLYWVADSQGFNWWGQSHVRPEAHAQTGRCGDVCGVAQSVSKQEHPTAKGGFHPEPRKYSSSGRMADSDNSGRQEQCGAERVQPKQRPVECNGGKSFWSDSILIPCGDGKARRIGLRPVPVASGIPGGMECSGEGSRQTIEILTKGEEGRVSLIRGYGNSIVAPLAAEFIKAYMEVADVRI